MTSCDVMYRVSGREEFEEIMKKEIELARLTNSNEFAVEYYDEDGNYINTIEVDLSNEKVEEDTEKIIREIHDYILLHGFQF